MKLILVSIIIALILTACNEQKSAEPQQEEVTEQIALANNFSFKTGYGDYEFLVAGVYKVDSTEIKVTHKGTDMGLDSFEVKIPGRLKGVFSSDVNENYKPELYLWSRNDENSQGNVLGFEFKSELQQLNFPPLTKEYAIGYFGKDSFYMKQDHFIRTFPVFEEIDNVITPTEIRRTLWYTLNDTGTLVLIN